MKHIIFLFIVFLSSICFAQIDVTFRVDMQYQTVSSNGVHVAGAMQGWDPSTTALSDDDGDGIWEVTLNVYEYTTYEYKFINGNSWGSDETVWGDCGAGNGNRSLVTENQNMLLPAYVFNSCDFTAYGCTDENAVNYDPLANNDDGSCTYPQINGCTDNLACNFNDSATLDDSTCVYADPGYDCDGNCIESDITWIGDQNGDGFVNVDPNSGDVYIAIESFPNTGTATLNINGNDYPMNYSDWGANAHWYYGFSAENDSIFSWSVTISNNCDNSQSYSDSFTTGCNGELFETCITRACDVVPTDLFVDNIINNRVTFNWSFSSNSPSDYAIRYRPIGNSSWTVITMEGTNADSLPNSQTHRTRWWMSPATTYEWSVRSRVLNGDRSINCQSAWSASAEYTTLPQCANLENLAVDNVEANWVTFFADAPDISWGVWQSKGKMREVGTNAFRYVNGGSDGTIAGVLKGNFTSSTDYEWHTKAWCTGNVDENGNPDPMYHSGWGDFSAFTTQVPCDKLPTNLTTSSNGANTAVTMSWDTPESGAPDHYFLEMTNLTTGAVYEWNDLDGESNSRTKFGQNPGDEISWRIRGACGTNGTSWATIFSQPETYTLGGARLANDVVSYLDVYPNPSRDIFNIAFISKEAQTISVKVVNMIGEEIYTEELTEFFGQFTKVIDMNMQPNGVYFLEIITSSGGINKKIVLN